MRLLDPLPLNPVSETASQPDLLSSVSLLADCLARSGTLEGCGADDAHHEVAAKAVAAALASERRTADLVRRLAVLERLALTDELTGLLNRRGFEQQLNQALSAAQRYGERGVLVYVDLDGFKPVNDRFGHAAGDAVLRRVAALLRDGVRASDSVARMGGDEFAVLLARTDGERGLIRAEILERDINGTIVPWDNQGIPVQASFGFQVFGPRDNAADILGRADEAMYRTKRGRRQAADTAVSAA